MIALCKLYYYYLMASLAGQEFHKPYNTHDIQKDTTADIKFYKSLCNNISYDNQNYEIQLLDIKKKTNYSYKRTKHIYRKTKHYYKNDGDDITRYKQSMQNVDDNNYYILVENNDVIIFIGGITEPNVHAVMANMRKTYGLM